MRALSTTVLAVLIIAALFWGNCYTCPQALLAQSHSCCHKNTRHTPKCETQSLRHFVKADGVDQAPAPDILAAVVAPDHKAAAVAAPLLEPAPDHTPPDLISFRV